MSLLRRLTMPHTLVDFAAIDIFPNSFSARGLSVPPFWLLTLAWALIESYDAHVNTRDIFLTSVEMSSSHCVRSYLLSQALRANPHRSPPDLYISTRPPFGAQTLGILEHWDLRSIIAHRQENRYNSYRISTRLLTIFSQEHTTFGWFCTNLNP